MYKRLEQLLLEGLSREAKLYKGRLKLHGEFLGVHKQYMDNNVQDFANNDYNQLALLRKKVPSNKKHKKDNMHRILSKIANKTAFKLRDIN